VITVTSNTSAKEKVCVFVRAYNASKYIDECLDSLINQDFSSEIYIKLLYDEGSTDNTLEYLERYVKYHNNQSNRHIEIIQHEHCSPFRSLLNGIIMFHDRYDYFSILDYDNLYNNQYISKAVETLKLSKSDFLYSNPIVIVGDLNHIQGKLLKTALFNIKSKRKLKYIILRGNFIDGSTIFMTKEGCKTIVSKLVDLSSPTYDWIFEDYAIGAVALYYLNFTRLEGNFIYYRIHESNITAGNKKLKKVKLNMDRTILTYSSFEILLGDKMNLAQKLIYLFFFNLSLFIWSSRFIFRKRI
jgi:glycosyltransferase involved in cell wall biosynthesis